MIADPAPPSGICDAPPVNITESISAYQYYFSVSLMSQEPSTYQSQVGVIQGIENGLHKPDFHVRTSTLERLARHFHAKVDVVRNLFPLSQRLL